MDQDIKTMKLYTDIERIERELKEAGYGDQGPVPTEVVHKVSMLSYSGVGGCEEVIDVMSLREGMSLVDVGSGLAGPARVISEKSGCTVKCVEMQQDIHELACSLTKRCGLDKTVSCVHGDATRPELLENVGTANDGVVTWLAVLHIPIELRPKLFTNVAKMLRVDGYLYIEDFFRKGDFTEEERRMLDVDVSVPEGHLPTKEEYMKTLQKAGFTDLQWIDLSETWSEFVADRHKAYMNDKDRHLRVHNEQVYDNMNHFYTVVRCLFSGASLGGVRIIARKA